MRNATLKIASIAMAFVAVACGAPETNPSDVVLPSYKYGPPDGRGGGGGETESWGNNLSVPVIFAEGKNLAGGDVVAGNAASTGLRPTGSQAPLAAGIGALPWFWGGNVEDLPGVYLQNTENTWMADWAVGSGASFPVLSYWGDNLTAQTWSINSVIRVEVNLKPSAWPTPMHGFLMPYASGTKSAEIKGTNGATAVMDPYVYSRYACLTIEKLDGSNAGDVAFDGCVDDAVADGPGGYAAEVNVSGLVTYGYNWMLAQDRTMSPAEKAGTWRLTFRIKTPNGKANIVAPADVGGRYGTPVVVPASNLTYLDIVISSNQSKKPENPGKGNKG